jgi:hypothetical protein
MIDIWIKVLPFLYTGIWGAQNLFDPSVRTIGPTDSMVVGGLGDIVKAHTGQGDIEGAFTYAYGWNFLNLRPEATGVLTANGDALIGVGVNDEYVFKGISLTPDGSMPVFFSWSAGPSYYAPGRAPWGNSGPHLEFHLINEVGFYVNHAMRVSVSYTHYSSGGLTNQSNPNNNSILLNIGYRF